MVAASRRRRPQSGHVRHAARPDRLSITTPSAPLSPPAPGAAHAPWWRFRRSPAATPPCPSAAAATRRHFPAAPSPPGPWRCRWRRHRPDPAAMSPSRRHVYSYNCALCSCLNSNIDGEVGTWTWETNVDVVDLLRSCRGFICLGDRGGIVVHGPDPQDLDLRTRQQFRKTAASAGPSQSQFVARECKVRRGPQPALTRCPCRKAR